MSNILQQTKILFVLVFIINGVHTSAKISRQSQMIISINKNLTVKFDPLILDNRYLEKKAVLEHFQSKHKYVKAKCSYQESAKGNCFCSNILSAKNLIDAVMTDILAESVAKNNQKTQKKSLLRTPTRILSTKSFFDHTNSLYLQNHALRFTNIPSNPRDSYLNTEQETFNDKSFHHSFRESPTQFLSRKILSYPTDDFYQEDFFHRNLNSEVDLLGRVVSHPDITKHNWDNRASLVQSVRLDKVHNSLKINLLKENLRPTKLPYMMKTQNLDTSHLSQRIFSPSGPLSEEPILGNFSNNCTTNCTEDMLHAPTFQRSTLIKGVVLSTISFMSFLGNMATLCSILRTGRQGTSTVYMLLLQLAVADLLVTLFCILAEGVWTLTVEWKGGNVLCKVVKFMQMFSLYLSTFVLVLIGFDRLAAVRFPMHRAHAKHHVRRGIVFIWILSGIFSAPQVAIFRVLKGPFVEEFHQCVTYGFYSAFWQEQLYTTITLVLMFLLPLLILVVTYVTTFVTITNSGRKHMFSEQLSRSTPYDDARHNILHKAKIKSLMITVVIVLTFVVCWTPYYAMMVIFMFLDPDEQLGQDLQSAIFFFGSSTALLNPLIYGAFHLRTKAKKPRSKSTSFYFSSSSKVENSNYRSCNRRSRGEIVNMHTSGRHHRFVNCYKSGMRNGMLVSSF